MSLTTFFGDVLARVGIGGLYQHTSNFDQVSGETKETIKGPFNKRSAAQGPTWNTMSSSLGSNLDMQVKYHLFPPKGAEELLPPEC